MDLRMYSLFLDKLIWDILPIPLKIEDHLGLTPWCQGLSPCMVEADCHVSKNGGDAQGRTVEGML